MSNAEKKPDINQDHVAKATDYKETAIKTAYTIAESTMLIVGEAGKFLGNMSFAGAKKIKELADKRVQAKANIPEEAKNKSDIDDHHIDINKPK